MGGSLTTNCTKARFTVDDVTQPCAMVMKEMGYYKEFYRKKDAKLGRRTPDGQKRYLGKSLDELSNMNDSPVEITIKVIL